MTLMRHISLNLGITFVMLSLAAFAQNEADSASALKRIVESGNVINAHEHIQGPDNVSDLLGMMDATGIQKTVLVGSSEFTLTQCEASSFTHYDENNAAILEIQNTYPERFEAWPTVRPEDPDMMHKVRDMVSAGARGIKLYVGHGYTTECNEYLFHTVALDDPRLMKLYTFCQAQHVPMCIHVNSDKPGFADEFVAVLSAFPNLKVNCPHFMLSTGRLGRLQEYLDCFPNLYVDISFGHDVFIADGLERLSRCADEFRALFEKNPDRFMFGTDFVFSDSLQRDVDWAKKRVESYYAMLSQDRYETPLLPGKTLEGLALSPELLEKILYKNFQRFSSTQPENTKLTRELKWRKMRVKTANRAPGKPISPTENKQSFSSFLVLSSEQEAR